MMQALARFRMLDLSRQLPGPFCSMLLADLGMDVVVIASPNDPLGMGIPILGRNKRSLTLNLKDPEGRAIFHKLAASADVRCSVRSPQFRGACRQPSILWRLRSTSLLLLRAYGRHVAVQITPAIPTHKEHQS